MRYFVKVPSQSNPLAVDIEAGDGGCAVVLEGRRYQVDAASLGPGALSLLVDGASFGIELEERGEQLWVTLRDQLIPLEVADERRLRLRQADAAFRADGKQVVIAPMPGKVVRVLVRVGDAVQAGQGLLVVEAMKMENELKSPKAGKVVELMAKEGTAVERNAKLVVVE